MAYEAEKQYMNACLNSETHDSEDPNGAFVAFTTFHGIDNNGKSKNMVGSGQQCHAHIYHMKRSFKTIDVMLDHIQGGKRELICGKQTPEESRMYLQYFMDHPLFSKSFFENDAEVALKERIMVRNLSALPANVCMFAIIATRGLWEGYQNKLPRRMADLLALGVSSDFAYIMAWYLSCIKNRFLIDPILDCGHTAIGTEVLSTEAVKNYLSYKTTFVAPGTLADGTSYSTNGYNVYSAFEPHYVIPWGQKKVNNFKARLEKFFSTRKIDADSLKELEASLRE